MNYINKLQVEVAERDIRIATLEQGLHDIMLHLAGPKFRLDDRIQAEDVRRMVRGIRGLAEDNVNDFHHGLNEADGRLDQMKLTVANRIKWICA